MSHLDEGALHAVLDGEVEAAELAAVERHLADCADCRARLEGAREFRGEAARLVEVLDEDEAGVVMAAAPAAMVAEPAGIIAESPPMPMSYPRPEPIPATPQRSRVPRWTRPVALAATIMIAVGLGYSIGTQRRPDLGAPAPSETAPPQAAEERAALPPPANVVSSLADEKKQADDEPSRQRQPAGEVSQRLRAGSKPVQAKTRPASETKAREAAQQLAGKAADTAPPPPPPIVAAAPPAADQARLVKDSARTEEGVAPRRAVSSFARRDFRLNEAGVADRAGRGPVISAATAIRTLGGVLRLVEGMDPERFELDGTGVRVWYRTAFGPLSLTQWRDGGQLQYRLVPPPGAPVDSVAAWAKRVK